MKFNTTNRFQSTPSVGRTTATQIYRCLDINISIHALRGGDDNLVGLYGRAILISIHALRGEDDSCRLCRVNVVNLFQSTPSVGRTTRSESIRFAVFHLFQSTPSVGRTTISQRNLFSSLGFQSTPSVGRTTIGSNVEYFPYIISIHALRGEDDDISGSTRPRIRRFQSTPSVGRTTKTTFLAMLAQKISIHALRGEDDLCLPNFQISPSFISIHALRGEDDAVKREPTCHPRDFNPRPPWGGRRYRSGTYFLPWDFNPRPPWGGRLNSRFIIPAIHAISIHALRGEDDQSLAEASVIKCVFQSTPSVGRTTEKHPSC